MFILMPISRGSKLVKPPYATIGIILITTFVFLITWGKERKFIASHHPASILNITGKTLANLMVEPDSPVSDETKELVQNELSRVMFPTELADHLLVTLNKQIEENYLLGLIDKGDIPAPEQPNITAETLLDSEKLLEIIADTGKNLYNPDWPWEKKWQAVYDEYQKERKKLEAKSVPFSSIFRQFGFDIKQGLFPGLFTHMFLHAGFMHLLFNMFFLWLAGAAIEERWGIPIFLGIYFTGGVAAAFAQHLISPTTGLDMVGASGAVAALMGAFLVRHTKMPINMFYLVWFLIYFKSGRFAAPAWVVLLLWVGVEFFQGWLAASLGIKGGVAYWAHVGGFVYGALAGYGIHKGNVAQNWEDHAESTDEGTQSTLDEAKKLRDSGKLTEAWEMSQRLLKLNPTHFGLLDFSVSLAIDLKKTDGLQDLKYRLLVQALSEGKSDLADSYLSDWGDAIDIDAFSDAQILGYGGILTSASRFEEAAKTYNHLIRNRPQSLHRGKAAYMMALLLKNNLHQDELALKWFQVLLNPQFEHEWGALARSEILKIQKKSA